MHNHFKNFKLKKENVEEYSYQLVKSLANK